MDKILFNKNKDDDNKQAGSSVSPSSVPNFNNIKTTASSYVPELSQKNWEESQKNLRWDSSSQGRAVIRLFSRGTLGAAGFALGNWYVSRGKGMAGYHSELKLSEISPTKPLQYVAKSIDVIFGKSISSTARMLGASEEEVYRSVHFRPTHNVEGLRKRKGRSLGREAVNITFDFFCSSVGDAMGRDIAGILDSKVKHDWKDNKGHIKYPEAAKTAAKSAWRYVSYNGGEDWAVAVPYAYLMRSQRKAINKFSQGFQLDAERGLNGGSFKVNKTGKVIGNYSLEGMLDLQGRFTLYNVGTLMYREVYNKVGDKIHGKNSPLYGSVNDKNNEKHGVLHNVGTFFKWSARSLVKGVIYMTPIIPFFSVLRSSQSKHRGLFINPETESALSYKNEKGGFDLMHANEMRRSYGGFKPDKNGQFPDVHRRRISTYNTGFLKIGDSITNHPFKNGDINPFKLDEGNPVLNKVGQGQNAIRSKINGIPKEKFGWAIPSKRFMDTYTNAAFAYTPYMYAKTEAAKLWDNGRMDASSERMIDGVASLNYKEFKAGASEVWKTILDRPFAEKSREEYALRRIAEDHSPSDSLTKEQGRIDALQDIARSPISWQQRVVHGGSVEKINDKTQVEKQRLNKQANYADQEAMRKVLKEFQPPTNSIH